MDTAEARPPWQRTCPAPGSTARASSDASRSESTYSSTSPESRHICNFSGGGSAKLYDPSAQSGVGSAHGSLPGLSKGSKGKPKHLPNRIKRYHERSMSGCLTCRKRRVKCDEGKPVCQRCACGDRTCVYVTATSPSPTQTSVQQSASLASILYRNDDRNDDRNDEDVRTPRSRPAGLDVSSLLHPAADGNGNSYGNGTSFRTEALGSEPRYPQQQLQQHQHQHQQQQHDPFRPPTRRPSDTLTGRADLDGYENASASAGSSVSVTPVRRGCYHADSAAVYGDGPVKTTSPYGANRSEVDYSPARKLPRTASSSSRPSTVLPSPTEAVRLPRGSLPKTNVSDLPPRHDFENLGAYLVTIEEQSLFRHFVVEVAPQLCVPGTPPAVNPWLQYIATLAVRDPAGSNAYAESLRSALLSISSLDLGTRLSQGSAAPAALRRPSLSAGATPSLDGRLSRRSSSHNVPTASCMTASLSPASGRPPAASSDLTSNLVLEISSRRRDKSLKLLRSATKGQSDRITRSDAMLLLATLLALATRDRLAGLQDWQEGLRVAARTLIEVGGPNALIHAADPASLFMVEQLASYEALGALTSDTLSLFLQPWDDWWHRLMVTPKSPRIDTVLQTLGINRGLVDVLARMTRVESTRQELQIRTGRTIALSSATTGADPSATLPPEYAETHNWLNTTARALSAELATWSSASIVDPSQQNSLLAFYNNLYVATAELYLQSVIFRRPAEHPAPARSMAAVMECCEEAIQLGHSHGLVMPLCFAALSALQLDRDRIRTMLFDLHRACHYDLDQVMERFEHVWRQVDGRHGPPDLRLVLEVACFNWSHWWHPQPNHILPAASPRLPS